MKVERQNVPMSYTEFLIQPFGPSGLSQPLNSSMLEVKTAPPPKILLAKVAGSARVFRKRFFARSDV